VGLQGYDGVRDLLRLFRLFLLKGPLRQDVNLYHDTGRSSNAQLPALVITAGELDEALLGLTAEPLVDAYLAPKIDGLFAWQSFKWYRRQRSGQFRDALRNAQANRAFISRSIETGLVITYLFRSMMFLAIYPVRPLLRRFLWLQLRKLLLAQASGLPPDEFNDATLAVRSDIGVPGVFEEGTPWNVAELIAGGHWLLPAVVERKRYAFLWSLDSLAERLGQATLWPKIERHVSLLERKRGYPVDQKERLVLQRACLVLEEKIAELGGAVQLSHSRYYGDTKIL
jgi:hypothetical protein